MVYLQTGSETSDSVKLSYTSSLYTDFTVDTEDLLFIYPTEMTAI